MKWILMALIVNCGWSYDFDTKPLLSKRCRELADQRLNLISARQKVMSLLDRTDYLLEKASAERKTVRAKLSVHRIQLERELSQKKIDIQEKDEQIIRKGCPRLTL